MLQLPALPLWAAKNWQGLAVGAIVAGVIGWGVNTWNGWQHERDISALEDFYQGEQERIRAELTRECEKDKQITTEASNAYQSNIADLNRQLTDFKRVRSQSSAAAQCVPVTRPAGGLNGPAQPGQSVAAHGLDANALYDYAAEAEQYRLQVIGLQSFVSRTWAAKGQDHATPAPVEEKSSGCHILKPWRCL